MGYLDYAGLQYLWGKLKEKFAPKSHSHDDRYYTEAEVDGMLNSKVNNNEAGADSLLSKLTTSWTATPTDDTYFIRQDTGGGDSFGRVKFSTLWNYIKGKTDGVYQPKGSYAASGHTHDDRYYTESEMNTKLSGKSNTDHTHKNVNDIGSNKPTTFAYSKSGMNYGDYSWLAGWNGYELRAVNKNQFAIADHTHPTSEIYGGNVNYSGYAGPIESAHIDVLRANRLAFLPASGIKVEYSVDGGATWIDYGATDDQKASLFAMRMGSAASFYTGKHTKADECTIKDQLRITVTPVDRYASVNMLYLWVSVAGTSATVNISRSTIGAKETFTDVRTDVPISGWSGPNEIRFSGGTFGGGSTQTSNAYAYRFTFKNKADGKGSVSVMDIRMYGPSAWSVPNSMMEKDHIYNWDANQNVQFPAQVTATKFNGSSTGVVDYGDSNGSTIKVGFGGAGLTKDKLTHIAGYAKDGNKTVIKDVSKSVLQSWLDLGASAYKKVQSLSAVGHSNWTNQSTDDGYVPTMAFMAFWNGAFNGSGNSNLQYCDRGRFGTIVTKNSGDYAAAGHTHDMSMLTGNIINTEPATNNHKIVLGKSGLDKCEFYEYGGIWNFYKMSSGEPNLVASIQSDGIHATLKGTADAANSVAWTNVTGKPSTYTPATHTHDDRYYTEAEINTKLNDKANSSHTHTKSQITDFPASLKNPTALTIQTNGAIAATYDGSAAKTVNITKSNIGLGNVDNTADANKSVKYATSAGTADSATTSNGVKDYNDANRTIKIGFAGAGLTSENLNYIAGYTDNGTKIKDVSKDVLKSWIGLGNYLPLIGGTMSGQITKSTGGSWIGDRDRAAIKSSYAGDSSYGAVAAMATKNGYWTMGNLGGNESLIFNYSTDAKYNAGKNETSQVYLPAQAGTIITSATIGSQSVNYANSAGNATNATNAANATTATKLSSNAGSNNQPVYFSGGKPVAIGYTIAKSVPADAKFTDTNTWRGVQNNLTSDSTDQSLSAAQGKALKALVDGKAPTSHKHTKSQITDFPSSMPASDVYAWAKAATKPSYTKAEVGLGNVDNTADKNKSVNYATSAGLATNAQCLNNDDKYMKFHWSGQKGQPTWLWGGNDSGDMYVYNPSNFNVNYATTAGNGTVDFQTKVTTDGYFGAVRFGNGVQICWFTMKSTRNRTFLLPFADINYAIAFSGGYCWLNINNRTTTGFTVGVEWSGYENSYIAIGRWK